MGQLRTEDERIQMLDEECRTKMQKYQQLSVATDNKLHHLRSLGGDFSSVDCCKSLRVLDFMKHVEEKRNFGDVSIRGNVQAVQLASHTTPSKPSYIGSSRPVNPVYKYYIA